MRLQNIERLQNLSQEISQRITQDSAMYATLAEVHQEMTLLQQNLTDIEQITDLECKYF